MARYDPPPSFRTRYLLGSRVFTIALVQFFPRSKSSLLSTLALRRTPKVGCLRLRAVETLDCCNPPQAHWEHRRRDEKRRLSPNQNRFIPQPKILLLWTQSQSKGMPCTTILHAGVILVMGCDEANAYHNVLCRCLDRCLVPPDAPKSPTGISRVARGTRNFWLAVALVIAELVVLNMPAACTYIHIKLVQVAKEVEFFSLIKRAEG